MTSPQSREARGHGAATRTGVTPRGGAHVETCVPRPQGPRGQRGHRSLAGSSRDGRCAASRYSWSAVIRHLLHVRHQALPDHSSGPTARTLLPPSPGRWLPVRGRTGQRGAPTTHVPRAQRAVRTAPPGLPSALGLSTSPTLHLLDNLAPPPGLPQDVSGQAVNTRLKRRRGGPCVGGAPRRTKSTGVSSAPRAEPLSPLSRSLPKSPRKSGTS